MARDPREPLLPPEVYARVFEGHHEGRQVFEALQQRFCGGLFVKGGEDGRRQTDFNLGANFVVNYILGKINQANGSLPDEQENDEEDRRHV